MKSHQQRVQAIADQVRQRVASGGFASLQKTAVSHVVPNPHDPKHDDRKIDIRGLDRILDIDVAARRCVAEPGVPFCDLVKKTLALGLLPKLVPELKTITIGGAIAGCSVESMSYKYGGFHDSCRSYEIVTGTGEILRCSANENPLVFEMIHGSYGTLGILTRAEFDLIPAKPYVRMEYLRTHTFEEFEQQMLEHCNADHVDFIDALVHGPNHFVLCLGTFVNQAPRTSRYDGLKVFYKSTAELREDYLTTYDYLFRYDTECHWLSRTLPIPGMEHPAMRLLLGRVLLGSTNMLTWSKRLRPLLKLQEDPHVVVDVFIPRKNFGTFFRWYEKVLDYYPLWVVPYRAPKVYPWIDPSHADRAGDTLYIDCAVYGKRNTPQTNYYKLLEDKTFELGGIKTLISRNSYDRETFWSVYNRQAYDKVKQQTDPHNLLRNLYDKFHPNSAR